MTDEEKERINQIIKEVYANHGNKILKGWEIENMWIDEAQIIGETDAE